MMKRRVKLAALFLARALGLFALSRWLTGPAVRILCYHGTWRVGPETSPGFTGDAMFISPRRFAARLDCLQRQKYPVITLDDALSGLAGRLVLPRNAVVITIDDGWFGTYADMLPQLQARDMPATLYCDTAQLQARAPVAHVMARWIAPFARRHPLPAEAQACLTIALNRAEPLPARLAATSQFADLAGIDLYPYLATRNFGYMTEDELRDATRRGLDVQLHSHRHELRDLSPHHVQTEVRDNIAALSSILRDGHRRRHFCYPSGIASPRAAAALRDIGIKSATTTVQGLAWPGADPLLLPRLLDGEQVSVIEFEAELSGFADALRRRRGAFSAWRARGRARSPLPGIAHATS